MGYSFFLLITTLSPLVLGSNVLEENQVIVHMTEWEQHICNIADLYMTEFESVVHCFGNDLPGNMVVKENTACLISEDKGGTNKLALWKCSNGQWITDSLGKQKHPQKRFFGFIAAIIGACVFLCGGGGGGSGGGGGGVQYVHKYPPTFETPCKPFEIMDTYYTASRQSYVNITWSVPTATDSDGRIQSVMQTSGQTPGSAFIGSAQGRQHTITYKATDNDGLTAYCSFSFVVYIPGCNPSAIWPMNGYRSCDLNSQLGSVCTYRCNDGYEITGNDTVTCQGDSAPNWTETPSCERITCGVPPVIENGFISCSYTHFGAICQIRCNSGYKLEGLLFIQCQIDGTWTPIVDTSCIDNLPPEIHNCITPQTFYADRGLTSTTVEWILPTASDSLDSNATVVQVGGQVYGSVFNVGSSVVSYKATDSEGNESGMCTIVIIVEEITCQHPYDILQDFNIEFSCNSYSYSYGTECELSCRFQYSLIGDNRIVCEWDSSTSQTAIGVWSWQTGQQPYCDRTECPIFDPPINGALALAYIGSNAIYTMSCNREFTIPEVYSGFSGQWICTNSGTYTPDIPVPDCVVPRTPRTVNLPAEIFYYDGDCSDPATMAQIRQNVAQIIAETVNPLIRELCPPENNCFIGNEEVTCGVVTGGKRRRRSDSRNVSTASQRKRREVPALIVEFYIYTTIIQTENQTVLQAITDVDNLQSGTLVPFMEELVANGTFDLDYFTLRNDSYQSPEYGDVNCGVPGYKLRQLSCEPCPPTYFLNSSDVCEFCPLGTYSDVEGLSTCTSCPLGYTTLQIGSRNESDCKELCAAGAYSIDGVVHCISCPKGYFQPSIGQTSCVQCSSGTTELSGSNSSTHCQAFHVLVNASVAEQIISNISSSMTDITFMFWVKLFTGSPPDVQIKLVSDGTDRLVIKLTDKFRVLIPYAAFDESVGDIVASTWTHVAVTWDTSENKINIYMKGKLIINNSSVVAPLAPITNNGNIILQSNGLTGILVADLHIEDSVVSTQDVETVAAQCWTERNNDVFNMSSFRDIPLDGISIQTPTFCDPVDDCASNPCNNSQFINHTCIDGVNTYTCYCVDGFTGNNCDIPPDFCANSSCQNGAACVNGLNVFTCNCPDGYSGDLCDVIPVAGGWSEWTDWTDCNDTCNGTQTRTRACDNPEPSPYGANCTGNGSETQSCNQGTCPSCPSLERGYGMYLNCSTDTQTDTQTCQAECRLGFVQPDNLASSMVFTCGRITGYDWEPMANPPDCVDPNAPDRLEVSVQLNTTTPINVTDETSYKDELIDRFSDVPCIVSRLCTVDINVTSPNEGNNGSVVEVTFNINLNETGDLDLQNYYETSNVSDALQEVIDSVNALENTGVYLNDTPGIFDVNVGGTQYNTDANSLMFVGDVTCPDGQTATDGVCAPCPDGTYYRDGNCVYCEKGSYSSSSGQTECTVCPVGFTTLSIGSYADLQCIESLTTVAVSSSTTKTPSTYATSTKSLPTIAVSSSTTNTPSTSVILTTSLTTVDVSSSTTNKPSTSVTSTKTLPTVAVSSSTTNTPSTSVILTTSLTTVDVSSSTTNTPSTSVTPTEALTTLAVSSSTTNTPSTYITSTKSLPTVAVSSSATDKPTTRSSTTSTEVLTKATNSISATDTPLAASTSTESLTTAAVSDSTTFTPTTGVTSKTELAVTQGHKDTEESVNTYLVIGIAALVVVLVMTLIVCTVFLTRRRSRERYNGRNNVALPNIENVFANDAYGNDLERAHDNDRESGRNADTYNQMDEQSGVTIPQDRTIRSETGLSNSNEASDNFRFHGSRTASDDTLNNANGPRSLDNTYISMNHHLQTSNTGTIGGIQEHVYTNDVYAEIDDSQLERGHTTDIDEKGTDLLTRGPFRIL